MKTINKSMRAFLIVIGMCVSVSAWAGWRGDFCLPITQSSLTGLTYTGSLTCVPAGSWDENVVLTYTVDDGYSVDDITFTVASGDYSLTTSYYSLPSGAGSFSVSGRTVTLTLYASYWCNTDGRACKYGNSGISITGSTEPACASPFGTLSVGGGATVTWSGSNVNTTVSLTGQKGSGARTWTLVDTPNSVATISGGTGTSTTVTIKSAGGAESTTVRVKCAIALNGDYCAEEKTIDITVNAQSYTYTYKANGGTPVADQTQTVYRGMSTNVKPSDAFTPPTSCKQFKEWNSNSSGTGATHYNAGASVSPTSNLTLYAIWEDKGPYTVMTDVSPAASGTATVGGETIDEFACGATSIALVASPAAGYYFQNWTKSPNTAAGGTIASANTASTTYNVGTGDATLTANFLPYLTLTYNANDGSGAPAAKTDCQSGVSFDLSNTEPTRSNYVFLGWSTDNEATSAQKEAGDSYSITTNTTLYAVWCPDISGSSFSTAVSGTTPTFNYSTGKGSTTFSWGSVTNATAYNLVIRNTTDGVDVHTGSVSANSSYTLTTMDPGDTYRATVTASNACTEVSSYAEKSIACPAITWPGESDDIDVGTPGKFAATITFTIPNAVSFEVWLTDGTADGSEVGGSRTTVSANGSGVASHTFTGLTNDHTYYVHAIGKNICNNVTADKNTSFTTAHNETYDTYQFRCVDFTATVPSGKAFVTSGYDGSAGKTILAKNPVHLVVTGGMAGHYVQIEPSDANVTVYFVKDGNFQVVNGSNQLRIANDGTFAKDIYFAYAPTSHGDGSVTVPTFIVRCDGYEQTFNADGSLLKVRAMPNSFAIAAKVGNTWHVLPADMGNTNGIQKSKIVRVDDNTNPTTAYTDDANAYRLWPIKGSTSNDFKAHGSYLRFSMPNNSNYALGASNSGNTGIGVYDALTLTASDGATGTVGRCSWDVTTTEEVSGGVTYFKYTLNHPYNTRNLILSSQKWGMYVGDATELRFLKIEEINEANLSIMEWGENQVVVRYPGSGTIALKEVSVNNSAIGTATMSRIGTSDLYIISGLSTLQANPSKTIQIGITETVAAVETDKESIFTIPYIIANGEIRNNTYLRDLMDGATAEAKNAIAKTVDVVVRQGGKFETTNTTSNFKDLYIYPGGKADLGHSIAHLENIYLRGGYSWLGDPFALPQMKATDGITITGIGSTGNGVFYDLYLNNSIYYMMALPKDVALASVTNEDGDDDWFAWVKGYSGKPRSLNPSNKGWSYAAGPNLERGKGYEIAIKPRLGRPYGTLRFPLQTSSTWSNETACSPSVVAWGMTEGELNDGVTANNAGWNLIGNPFFTAYNNSGSDAILIVDSLTKKLDASGNWTGAYEWNTTYKVKYFTIPGYTTEDYKDVRAVPYKLDAFYPFFVQVNSGTEASPASLTFGTANRALKMPMKLSYQADKREVNLDIQLADEMAHTDVMGLNINNEYSSAFDKEDKEKTLLGGENYMKIYTLVGNYRVAFNSLSETAAAQPIPVGVITPDAGYYTFSLVDGLDVTEVEHVWLWDYEKSSQTDLLVEDYQFYSTHGQLEDRFAINVILKTEPEVPTDVEVINVEASDVPYKFIWQDHIYIMYRGVVYDITGRRVMEINK